MIGGRRVRAMGGPKTLVSDVAILAVPMGVIGGRIYHVITSPEKYFGGSGDPISALYILDKLYEDSDDTQFSLEYGVDTLDESLRDWLRENDFLVSLEDDGWLDD